MRITSSKIEIFLQDNNIGGILQIWEPPTGHPVAIDDEEGLIWFYPNEDSEDNKDIVGLEVQDFNDYWSHHRDKLFKVIASKTGDNLEDVKRIIEPYWK